MPGGQHLALWRAALSKFAEKSGNFKIPKKGTPEHNDLYKIYEQMRKDSGISDQVVKKFSGEGKKPRAKKLKGEGTKLAGEGMSMDGCGTKLAGEGLLLAGEKRTRKPRTPKVAIEMSV